MKVEYRSAEVAQMVQISKKTLLEWCRKGKIEDPKRDYLGHRVWRASDIAAAFCYCMKGYPERQRAWNDWVRVAKGQS